MTIRARIRQLERRIPVRRRFVVIYEEDGLERNADTRVRELAQDFGPEDLVIRVCYAEVLSSNESQYADRPALERSVSGRAPGRLRLEYSRKTAPRLSIKRVLLFYAFLAMRRVIPRPP